MTGHRDPVEDWLSRDIEVLPPPPGAFGRVRRRARRRKAIQAASAAAGVAVIVAAGISVPALTGSLFRGAGPAKVGSPGPTAPPARSVPGPALPDAGRGPAVPAGFRPSSVTFVGYQGGYLGAVLGQAPCGGRSCTAIAGTTTYGGRWAAVGAPPARPAAVSQIRFADPASGWAYGPALYATHDGGLHWARAAGVTGRVVDLAAVGGRVLAVAATACGGTGPGTAAGCTRFALYSAAASGGPFARALSLPAGTRVFAGGLQLARDRGYLITNGGLYSGQLSGAGWAPVAAGAGSTGPACLAAGSAPGPWLLAPGAGRTLYLACGAGRRLTLYESADGGSGWQAHGAIPATGTATSLAVSPAGTLVLATTDGLYYLSPGARTWRPAAGGSTAGVAFRYVGMTSSRLGVAVPGPATRQLFVTRDGGRTWQASPVSR